MTVFGYELLGRDRMRLGAWLWVGCLQFFVAEEVARLGWTGRYSLRWNYISDLGRVSCSAVCSHWHAVMNGSFLLQGLLIAGGALLVRQEAVRGRVSRMGQLARVCLVVSGAGLVLVATHPEDVDTAVHVVGAELHFGFASVAMLLWWLGCMRDGSRDGWRRGAWVALGAAAVAIFGDVVLSVGAAKGLLAGLGPGLVERLAAYPLPLWLAWTGVQMLGGVCRAKPQAGDL